VLRRRLRCDDSVSVAGIKKLLGWWKGRMNETFRTVFLWIVIPICAYSLIPIAIMFITVMTPQCVHDNPKCAVWTICFATFTGYWIGKTGGSGAFGALAAFTLGVLWHFAKYLLLLQLTYDPVLRFFLKDADEYITDLSENYGAMSFRKTVPRSDK
jgi:hypothetical protein